MGGDPSLPAYYYPSPPASPGRLLYSYSYSSYSYSYSHSCSHSRSRSRSRSQSHRQRAPQAYFPCPAAPSELHREHPQLYRPSLPSLSSPLNCFTMCNRNWRFWSDKRQTAHFGISRGARPGRGCWGGGQPIWKKKSLAWRCGLGALSHVYMLLLY